MLKKPLILPEGFPFILATMALACFFFWMKWYYLAVIPRVISVYFTYFFRCPPRNGKIPPGDDVLVSPADGTVVDVSDDVYEYTYLGEKCHKITIFLSIFDVHCNRSPMAGKSSTSRMFRAASFLPIRTESALKTREARSA